MCLFTVKSNEEDRGLICEQGFTIVDIRKPQHQKRFPIEVILLQSAPSKFTRKYIPYLKTLLENNSIKSLFRRRFLD